MSTPLPKSFLFFCCFAVISMASCVAPRKQIFIDVESLPFALVGREHRAFASGDRLKVEVSQIPGFHVRGLEAFEHEGALYVFPRHISSGGDVTSHFKVDVAKYGLGPDWPQHVYWLCEQRFDPVGAPGFWSSGKRLLWTRKRMEIVTQ